MTFTSSAVASPAESTTAWSVSEELSWSDERLDRSDPLHAARTRADTMPPPISMRFIRKPPNQCEACRRRSNPVGAPRLRTQVASLLVDGVIRGTLRDPAHNHRHSMDSLCDSGPGLSIRATEPAFRSLGDG